MSTTVKINESCTVCETCLGEITIYTEKWKDAVHSESKPTSFNIGTDGYAEFEKARDVCPVEAIEEEG